MGCAGGDSTKLAVYTDILSKDKCSDLCAKHSTCEYFIYGKSGTPKEGICRLQKGKCIANANWANFETFKVTNRGALAHAYPPPAAKGDTRFDWLHDNGCESQDKLKMAEYDENNAETNSLQGCANKCGATDGCTFFLTGKVGWDKEGDCFLGGGVCNYTNMKGNYVAYSVVADPPPAVEDLVNAEHAEADAKDFCNFNARPNNKPTIPDGAYLGECSVGENDIRGNQEEIKICFDECCDIPECGGFVASKYGVVFATAFIVSEDKDESADFYEVVLGEPEEEASRAKHYPTHWHWSNGDFLITAGTTGFFMVCALTVMMIKMKRQAPANKYSTVFIA
jgi:hypothetical protein